MLDGSRETVQPGDKDGIEAPVPGIGHQAVEFWASVLHPGNPNVGVLTGQREAALLSVFPERHKLRLEIPQEVRSAVAFTLSNPAAGPNSAR